MSIHYMVHKYSWRVYLGVVAFWLIYFAGWYACDAASSNKWAWFRTVWLACHILFVAWLALDAVIPDRPKYPDPQDDRDEPR